MFFQSIRHDQFNTNVERGWVTDNILSLPYSEPFSHGSLLPEHLLPYRRFEIRRYGTTPYHAAIHQDCTCSLVVDLLNEAS